MGHGVRPTIVSRSASVKHNRTENMGRHRRRPISSCTQPGQSEGLRNGKGEPAKILRCLYMYKPPGTFENNEIAVSVHTNRGPPS